MNIENPGPGESRKQAAERSPKWAFVCICEAASFPPELRRHLSKREAGNQDSEQAGGSGIGPGSARGDFPASVNLCLMTLARLSENPGPPETRGNGEGIHSSPANVSSMAVVLA